MRQELMVVSCRGSGFAIAHTHKHMTGTVERLKREVRRVGSCNHTLFLVLASHYQ